MTSFFNKRASVLTDDIMTPDPQEEEGETPPKKMKREVPYPQLEDSDATSQLSLQREDPSPQEEDPSPQEEDPSPQEEDSPRQEEDPSRQEEDPVPTTNESARNAVAELPRETPPTAAASSNSNSSTLQPVVPVVVIEQALPGNHEGEEEDALAFLTAEIEASGILTNEPLAAPSGPAEMEFLYDLHLSEEIENFTCKSLPPLM